MNWWLWLAGGLALVVAELVTPSGFFIIFFGLGALTVGVLATLEILTAGWAQWLVFTALSIAYLVIFRGRFQARFQMPPPPNVDSLVGGLAIVQERLLPGVVGKVEVRGSIVERAEHQHRDARCRPARSCGVGRRPHAGGCSGITRRHERAASRCHDRKGA